MRISLCLASAALALVLGCEARLSLGAACTRTSDCQEARVCVGRRCRDACREQRDCPLGTFCRFAPDGSGACALPDDPDCRTAGCSEGLECVGALCVNRCSSVSDCPAGSACVATLDAITHCVRLAAVDAGVSSDVEPAGDAAPDAGGCVPGACDPVVRLAVGNGFTCALTASEAVWCWGSSDSVGRGPAPAGCGTTACVRPAPLLIETTPGDVREARGVVALTARRYGGCIAARGEPVMCWASRYTAAPIANMRDGRYARPALRVDDTPLFGAVDVHLMLDAALARLGGGAWAAWGSDAVGQFGGPTPSGDAPRVVDVGPPVSGSVTLVAAGDDFTCAIVAGEVWCWGGNEWGQAGDAAGARPGALVAGATRLAGVSGAIELALGESNGCALTSSGDVLCWGRPDRLGVAGPPSCAPSGACAPTRVTGVPPGIRHLATAGHTSATCVIDGGGGLWCWGDVAREWVPLPTRIDLPGPVTAAVVSDRHACAVIGGDVHCWGDNYYGALGRPTPAEGVFEPAPVEW